MTLDRCYACGGDVQLRSGMGRVAGHLGTLVAIPEEFELPTCGSCGETWLDEDQTKRLTEALYAAGVQDPTRLP